MIKMLVIDLDETLLHNDKTISQFSEEVLQKASMEGIKIVFATARPIRATRDFQKQISCDAVICHNGTLTLVDGKLIGNHQGIPMNEAIQILNTMQNKYPDKKLSIEINDKIYANFDTSLIWGKSENDREMLRRSTVYSNFSDLPDFIADKVLIEINSENEYQEILANISTNLYAQLSDGGKLCLVMNKSATKFNAIAQLAELWSIPISQIAAFGDDYNDIEMLLNCGVGIAMGNAIIEVLEAADAVTDTNNEDGVAKYIMNSILCQNPNIN
ncbi:MAG: HAD family hydrolase [Lentimicrobiaceae bacterium]|nr:HAD family hydrolase [Lentimicrobiaceae bacterium]